MTKITQNFNSAPISAEVVHSSEATIALVTMEVDGVSYTWTGTAKKDPTDKFDPEVGTKLALARAFTSAASQMNRQAQGKVKCIDDNARASAEAAARRSQEAARVRPRRPSRPTTASRGRSRS